LCEALTRDGYAVVGVDNFNDFYDPAVKRQNIAGLVQHPHFTLYEADIRTRDAMFEIGEHHRPEVIVHLAAMAGVRPSIADPELYEDVNLHGTTVLLETARRYGTAKFIFASSSSVYGNNPKVPFAETDNVDFPISPYAATKKAGELLCHTYHHLFGLGMTCLRFFTVYGPRQRPDLAIHKFARLIEAGKPIPVFGDGSMSRDYTYIDDIIQGIRAALDACQGYAIYNLGNSEPVRLSRLITLLEEALGKKALIDRQPLQPGDVRQTYADITRAREELGYQPRTDIQTGLKHFVRWLRHS